MMKEIEKGIENMFDASKGAEISFEDLDELDCVHVIRCKDCMWKDHPGCAILIHGEEDKPSDMDYCSFAERKEK